MKVILIMIQRHLKAILFAVSIVLSFSLNSLMAAETIPDTYISNQAGKGRFPLAINGEPIPIIASSTDDPGTLRAINDLKTDLGRVTGKEPTLYLEAHPSPKYAIIAGTLGGNPLIDQLAKNGKIDVSAIESKREAYISGIVRNPVKGIDQAFVIAGSDKRGTIFGVYDLSAQIGVSPWHWWADVPVKENKNLYVLPGWRASGEPAVKYRGIFINDEAPALSGWAYEKFGGFNHQFYEHVFELILRMKGNFLWPAMWGRAFYDDDPMNPKLAHEYGVVIGTSHHEPMMRAHDEWRRFGEGPWNYEKNPEVLRDFWRESIERTGEYESVITVGMRGDGDEPMTEGTAIELLQKIVKDQRQILTEVTGKQPEEIPQVWALYKEVQDYYDNGMRVPDDITLLLCDDNWGNIRKLPRKDEEPRAGGYGIYYHYDYVGGPRNYKWLNTNPIARVWEQMHLAYQYGATDLWIVNVGDIKPMEFPIEFFLDYAWDPEKWPAEKLPEYTRQWAAKQFGPEHAAEIAGFLTDYTKFNGRRKPELLSPETYSLHHYREAERVVEAYNELAANAERVYQLLPEEYRDAYYQLVLFPIQACANLNELYFAAAKNRMYARQGRAATNDKAEKVKRLFARDVELTDYYNNKLAGGKWSHMMDQTHIGYTYWQQPETNAMPEVKEITLSDDAQMGVYVEGSEAWFPSKADGLKLPDFDVFNDQPCYLAVFNRGTQSFEYTINSDASWIKIDHPKGRIEKERRIRIGVDWEKLSNSSDVEATLTIHGPGGESCVVTAKAFNPAEKEKIYGFVESDGYISIEAENFKNKIESAEITWKRIPDLGRTVSGMTPFPVTADPQIPGGDSPRLEYPIHFFHSGEMKVRVYLSPTLNFHNNQGLRFAVSFDDEAPQIVNMHTDNSLRTWEKWVSDNIAVFETVHTISTPGSHTLKFWMVDPAVVLQKIVIDAGGLRESYLGPPESYHTELQETLRTGMKQTQGFSNADTQNKLTIGDSSYFENRGFNALVFSNWYNGLFSDSKISGMEFIHHGVRTATNGDVRLSPTPEQWDPIPTFVKRNVNKEENTIEAFLSYPDHDFSYRVKAEGKDQGILVTVNLDKPLPKSLEGKAGFNFEFLPSAYFGKPFIMDEKPGVFPLYPSGSMEMLFDRMEPKPFATGKILTLAPEDPERMARIEALSGELAVYDGRNQAQNGWYVVRSLIPSGVTGAVVEWFITPNTVPGWTRLPMIAYSQVGYHPAQAKTAVIELDKNDAAAKEAKLIRISSKGEDADAFIGEVKLWGGYLRYNYLTFDFTEVREPGLYAVEYDGQRTKPFSISTNVYSTAWHPTSDIFFPVQMDHMFVNEAYRVWHGTSHLDDALQAPPNHEHFDLYAMGASTDTPFKPGEHIPGLNIGGWYDAGDYDIRTQTQYTAVLDLVQVWENFRPERDETTVNQQTRFVDIHKPDGKPDLLQQIEHGALGLIAQHRAVGHAIHGIVESSLSQYTHLGDASTKTDNLVYNPTLDSLESDGFSSGSFDDRWAFTTRSSALNYGSIAGLAAASRALRGYNDSLAEECLSVAENAWNEEQSHEPFIFYHGNTTGGPLDEEQMKAAIELLACAGDKKYADKIGELWPSVKTRLFTAVPLGVKAMPYMDKKFRKEMEALAKNYAAGLDRYLRENPFGVPISTTGWAGNGLVIRFALNNYILHNAFPGLIDPEHIFRGLNYIYGCHPGSNISFVSGVGMDSKKVAYGANRADYSFIAGGIVPGVLILSPDYPENKEDWPFLWGENEYVVNLGGSYIYLVHAVNDLLNSEKARITAGPAN